MYPAGHPSLAPAARAVAERAGLLLTDRATLSLGVARNQLVIEGVATDPKHPVLRELASRLHRHHLGAVTFSRDVNAAEIGDVLKRLAVEADRTGQPLGLGPVEELRQWPHVRLHPLTYEKLELVDEEAPPDSDVRAARARGAQLWVGLARAALATEGTSEPPPSTEPAVIARAIDERGAGSTAAYDQAIVGYMLQIAEELKSAGSAEAIGLRRRMSRLIRGLKPETLRRLVEMGGDFAQRQQFVADATDGMALDAVLEIVQAAAASSGQTISHALVRMLSKLAAHAAGGSAEARSHADEALRDQVRHLIRGWTLADPNPGTYGAALQRMARAAPVFTAPSEEAFPTEPDRIVAMGIELDSDAPPVLAAAERVVVEGRAEQLFEVLDGSPNSSATVDRVWDLVARADVVRKLSTQEPPDFKMLDRLVTRVGVPAADALLDALAAASSLGRRRGFFGLLVRLGPAIGEQIVRRMEDGRWYVMRNSLALLEAIGQAPAGFSAAPLLSHADARVRLQALKLQLKLGEGRNDTLAAALQDPDHRVVAYALTAVQRGCPDVLAPLVARRALDRSLPTDLRVLAIRALGGTQATAAREALLALAEGGRSLLGRERLATKSPELLAALTALATGWGSVPAARRVLARAGASSDADIRAATDPRVEGR